MTNKRENSNKNKSTAQGWTENKIIEEEKKTKRLQQERKLQNLCLVKSFYQFKRWFSEIVCIDIPPMITSNEESFHPN